MLDLLIFKFVSSNLVNFESHMSFIKSKVAAFDWIKCRPN